MRCIVLGSAAGGGFPQWNCGCLGCTLARAGDPRAAPRTQMGMAVSADGAQWALVGASPDLRQQILQTRALAPRGPRHSPIVCVVLLNADVDGLAGLLVLREQQRLRIYAAPAILRVLRANPIFASLDPALVDQVMLETDVLTDIGVGLSLTLLEMPGKIPLYQEDRAAAAAQPAVTYAARLQAGDEVVVIAPACAEITQAVLDRLQDADKVFFDGTLFTDDEMIAAGLSHKSSRRMGHVPVSGPGGSLEKLAGLSARCIYLHINNSNPMLIEGSPERKAVEAAGLRVAHDGMSI